VEEAVPGGPPRSLGCAIRDGADYIVVGGPIRNAPDAPSGEAVTKPRDRCGRTGDLCS
jgi:hypothetical protein